MGSVQLVFQFSHDEEARAALQRAKDTARGGVCTIALEDFRFLYDIAGTVLARDERAPDLTLRDILQGCRMVMADAQVPEFIIDQLLEGSKQGGTNAQRSS